MVAAGIADDATAALVVREGRDLVVGAAQFEGADGLKVLGLEVEFVFVALMRTGKQRSADRDVTKPLLGKLDVVEVNDGGLLVDNRNSTLYGSGGLRRNREVVEHVMMGRRWFVRKSLWLCVGLVVIVAGASADDWNKTYNVNGRAQVVVRCDDGSVRVSGSNQPQVQASVTTVGYRISPGEVQVEENQSGNRVEITVRVSSGVRWGFGSRSIRVTVSVPQQSDLDLNTKDGSISVDDVKGTHQIFSGDGRIEARGLDGSLKAETHDGSMNIDGRFDMLQAHTGDGRIEVDVKPGSKMNSGWYVRTGDGSITLRLPQDFTADLEAHTGDGRINVDLPVTTTGAVRNNDVRGKLNGGGYPLEVRSGDGSIRLGRY